MKAHYDKVTWLFVTRNFKDDDKDREAARTHDRFGISSWPQLVLFDPRDDRVLADMPRGFEPWVRALQPLQDKVPKPGAAATAALAQLRRAREAAKAGDADEAARLAEEVARREDEAFAWLGARELLRSLRGDDRPLRERLVDPDVRERAIAIESLGAAAPDEVAAMVEPVAERLRDGDEHIVVRLRALAFLARVRPALVAADAAALLDVPHDAFRNAVLTVVAAHPDPALGPQLARLFAGVGSSIPSRNPNVLRMHVARCFVGSGDATAIDAVAPVVREANTRNGTTKAVVDALGGLAPRLADADRQRVVALLLEGMPAAVAAEADTAETRRALALVRDLRTALQRATGTELPAPPQTWLASDRADHLTALSAAVR